MEPTDPSALSVRARRAYERGRVLWALRRSAPLLGLLAAALLFGHPFRFALGTGLLLLATSLGLLWRGEVYARAVYPGVAAGAVPFFLSVLAGGTRHVCSPSTCYAICVACCIGGGLAAGFLVGRSAARLAGRRTAFLLSAGTVAVLVASPGCALAGVAGVVGMLGGVVIGTAPAVLVAAPTS